jgi:uncharacterized protein (DUF2461 family)
MNARDKLEIRHFAMLDTLNATSDPKQRDRIRDRLEGFRTALDEMGIDYCVACDMYYINSGVDRAMTAGIWHEPDSQEIHRMWRRQNAQRPEWMKRNADSAGEGR